MNTLIMNAPAKINLALDILGKDPSGYHFVQTVLQEVPFLSDTLTVTKTDTAITVEWQSDSIAAPAYAENLVVHAAQLFFEKTGVRGGAHIIIQKKIPDGAGLGGGSSDAAATLKALNTLYETNLSDDTLREWSAYLGVDVPFFIRGGTALATHFGEKITQLPNAKLPAFSFLFGKTPVKTSDAYAALDLSACSKKTGNTEKLMMMIHAGQPLTLNLFHNDFTDTIQKNYAVTYAALIKEVHAKDASTFWLTGASLSIVYFVVL